MTILFALVHSDRSSEKETVKSTRTRSEQGRGGEQDPLVLSARGKRAVAEVARAHLPASSRLYTAVLAAKERSRGGEGSRALPSRCLVGDFASGVAARGLSMRSAATFAGSTTPTVSKAIHRLVGAVKQAERDGREIDADVVLGAFDYLPRGGARKGCTKLEPKHLETLRQLATAQDTMTLTVRALRERLYRAHPELRVKTISESRLCAVLVHELDITIKKLTRMAREGLTEPNLAKRKAYATEMYNGVDVNKVGVPGPDGEAADMKNWRPKKPRELYIYMDESGFNLTTTQATRGRSKKGTPASTAVKYQKGVNHSLLLSLHMALPGMAERIPLAWKQGSFKRVDFVKYVEDELGPFMVEYRAALPAELRNETIHYVMDNASIHKGDLVKDALAKIGLTATYLSPYSPVFNPCELIFGKVKRTIRADERVAEDSDQLRDFVMDGLARVSPSDIEGFYRHCGLRT